LASIRLGVVEALTEPAVYRRQQVASPLSFSSLSVESGEPDRSPELERTGAALARRRACRFERRSRFVARSAGGERELAPEPVQLRLVPTARQA
jgi:hypothetical protein